MKETKVVYLVVLLLLLIFNINMLDFRNSMNSETIPTATVSSITNTPILTIIEQYNPNLTPIEKEQIITSVDRYSRLYNVPINLILSVIAAESRFDPLCKGTIDDTGLMQIRQKYAPYWAKKINLELTNLEQLWEIDINIKLGTSILRNLMNNYEGDLEKILVAYNAGQTFVDKMIKENQTLPKKYLKLVDKHHYKLFGEPVTLSEVINL